MALFEKAKKIAETATNLSDKFSQRGTAVDNVEAETVLEKILINGESVNQTYKGLRDLLVFTNKRIIKVDIQGITGKKKEYLSIPYKSVQRFSIETAGTFDMDAELKLFGSSEIIFEFEFGKNAPIFDVQKHLAEIIL